MLNRGVEQKGNQKPQAKVRWGSKQGKQKRSLRRWLLGMVSEEVKVSTKQVHGWRPFQWLSSAGLKHLGHSRLCIFKTKKKPVWQGAVSQVGYKRRYGQKDTGFKIMEALHNTVGPAVTRWVNVLGRAVTRLKYVFKGSKWLQSGEQTTAGQQQKWET